MLEPESRQAVEAALGHTFANPDLLVEAMTHASVAETRQASNERLEFLGDAILGMVVCEELFQRFPEMLEGDLTKIKSSVVSRRTCAAIARKMGLDDALILGKGMSNRPDLPSSLAAAVFEAVIAAVYLDGGIDAARAFILRCIKPVIERAVASGHQQNFKSLLQQHAQKHFGQNAAYVLLDENGPDHAKCFEMCVEIGTRRFPSNWSDSKKRAEQGAALNALVDLELARRDEATGDVILIADASDDGPATAAARTADDVVAGVLADDDCVDESDTNLDLEDPSILARETELNSDAERVPAIFNPDDLGEDHAVTTGPSAPEQPRSRR